MQDDHVEDDEVEDDDVEDDDAEENENEQDRGPHFVGACAVAMHLDISQEPLRTRIYR